MKTRGAEDILPSPIFHNNSCCVCHVYVVYCVFVVKEAHHVIMHTYREKTDSIWIDSGYGSTYVVRKYLST